MLPKVIRQAAFPSGKHRVDFLPFAEALFDREEQARKAAPILKGILDAGSPRLSDISHKMPGSPDAGKTAFVGRLSDGKTRGFFLLTVAQPYTRGELSPSPSSLILKGP